MHRSIFASLVAIVVCLSPPGATARASTSAVRLEQLMSVPIPANLVAAPTGARFAWVSSAKGRRNLWVADVTARGETAYPVSSFTDDDGTEVGELTWNPTGQILVYTRGGLLKSGAIGGGLPNPGSLVDRPPPQEIWAVSIADMGHRRLAQGRSASISPKGDLVAYLNDGQIWLVPIDGSRAPRQLVHDNGAGAAQTFGQPPEIKWSPDGRRLAFVSRRGDHSFVGIYSFDRRKITWLSPSVDFDTFPIWSPDGRHVAFVRIPSGSGGFPAPRTAFPWSIWVADADTGDGHAIWQAETGLGSAYPSLDSPSSRSPLLWTASEEIVFPWERTGWMQLYAVSSRGGRARALTSGKFEVYNPVLTPDRNSVVYAANKLEPDRRHLWRVAVSGGAAVPLTRGASNADFPVLSGDGRHVAALLSSGVAPVQPSVIAAGGAVRALAPATIPKDYPASRLAAPLPVTFRSVDGLTIHGQLFLPPSSSRKPRPALLFFHGGPHKQMLLAWSSETYNYANCLYLAAHGYVVLSVNYRGSVGYGTEFRLPTGIAADGGSEVNDIRAAALYLGGRPDVDAKRIGIWGHSYGGMMAALGLAHMSDLLAAGVDHSGLSNWRSLFIKMGLMTPFDPRGDSLLAASPIGAVKTWKSPVLIIHGDDDRNAIFSQAVELIGALRQNNVDFEQKILPNEMHNPMHFDSVLSIYQSMNEFLDRRLAKQEP